MGADRVGEALPPLVRAVRDAGHPVVWVCDPMHANTFRTATGRKTRDFGHIMAEIEGFFAVHHAEGTWPGGVHLEITGDDVTECLGGSDSLSEEQLDDAYTTLCDPRLERTAVARPRVPRRRADARRLMRLAVVGTGLMGASVGLAAKRAGVDWVGGHDADEAAAGVALERGAVDEVAPLDGAARRGRPRGRRRAGHRAARPRRGGDRDARPSRCTVTDVGSTKDWSLRFPERFVGGHPVCGREARGPAHATADLFDGATWFLTPVAATDPERYRLVHGFVASLGAVPVAIDPKAHDRLVALTSHLPHALANLLVNQAGSGRIEGHDPLAAAGGSLRDMTRVAGANPRIWVDIFLDNAPELREALAEHRRRVEQLEQALADGDGGYLARWVAEASENRRRMLAEAYPDPGELQQVTVHVPDRPGVLAGITQALGAERINIEDFELRHFSPERGGVLTMLVSGADEAARAATLLEAQGYGVSVSPVLQ